jgi:hypothetical protein
MTSLYLTTASQAAGTPGGAETTRWRASGTPGASARACNKNTVAGPTAPLPVTDSATAGTDGNSVAWYSDPLGAVTITGQIVASLWGRQSATAGNAAPCFGMYACDAAGAVLATIVDPATVGSQGGLELSTAEAAATCTVAAASVADTVLAAGQRLKITLCIDDAADQGGTGTMTSGQNARLYVNGKSGQSGSSQITFTETILSTSAPVVFPAVAGHQSTPPRNTPTIT